MAVKTVKTAPPEVTKVLDQIEAYNEFCRNSYFSTALSELAFFLGKPYVRAYEWVIKRQYVPQIETYLTMQKWINKKIAALPPKGRARYNDILKLVIKQNQNRSKT